MPSLKKDLKGWKMQSRNKARIEELEMRSGTNESKTLAVEWIEDGKKSIKYNGKEYSSEEFRKLFPSVKVLTVEFI